MNEQPTAVTPPVPQPTVVASKEKPKLIKVRALSVGQYKGRTYEHGDIFYVEEKFFADAHHGDKNIARFGWMEKIERDDIDKPEVVISKDETDEQKKIREHANETKEETERRVRAEEEQKK
jgi:hypothetical protein